MHSFPFAVEKLFSAWEFRFSLEIGSVEPADFFRNVEGDRLLELRRQALDSSLSDYLRAIPDGNHETLVGLLAGAGSVTQPPPVKDH